MTLAEVVRRLDRYLGGEDSTEFYTVQRRLDAINDAQQEVSYQLRIPRRYADVETPSPFTLPVEARGGGLISIKPVIDSRAGDPLPLLTVAEAEREYPNWSEEQADNTSKARFAIYDPSNITAPVYIVPPHTDTRLYRVEYFKAPHQFTLDDYENGNLVLFDGDTDFAPAHQIVPIYAAHLLWEMIPDETGAYKSRYYEKKAKALIDEYYPLVNRSWVRVRNDYLRSYWGSA